jgi:hypothetical protein
MLRVTVEMWPGGDSSRARTLATIDLANVSNLEELSDYRVEETDEHGRKTNTLVLNHERARGWRKLLWRALGNLQVLEVLEALKEE